MFRNRRVLLSLILIVLSGMVIAVVIFIGQLGNVTIPRGTPSGELAFISDRAGKWDIYLIDEEGTITNLTDDGQDEQDYFASFDFASERVNFLSGRSGEIGPAQVSLDSDDTTIRTLGLVEAVGLMFGEGRFDWDPAWSPDGERLVWSSLRDFNLELYVSPVDDENARTRLTQHPGRDWFAAWSPDGTQLAFASDREGNEDVYLIDATGGDLTSLTDNPADDIRPTWSLDGETILFVSERDNELTSGQLDLFTIDPTNPDSLTPFDRESMFEGGAVWSPDGSQVVYMSNAGGSWSLYQRDADGGNVRRLTDGEGNDLFPVWRPATD